MLNLVALAEANGSRWEATFRDLSGRHTALAEFAQWVQESSRISLNCGWSTVTHLLKGDCLKNHHELAREKAERDGSNPDDHLRASLKEFYQRRVAFDHAFENGEAFRYGALNGGCVGLENYGPLCLVLGMEKQESLEASACLLPGDSLFLCTNATEDFDESRTTDLVGAFRQRAIYVSTNRFEAIAMSQKAEWLRVLLNSDNRKDGCVEVIFVGTVTIKDLEAVRLSQAAHDAAWNAVFAAHAPDARISTKATAADLTAFFTAVRHKALPMEIIL